MKNVKMIEIPTTSPVYQALEYIDLPSGCAIDTGVYPDDGYDTISIDFIPLVTNPSTYSQTLFGLRHKYTSSSVAYFELTCNSSDKQFKLNNSSWSGSSTYTYYPSSGTINLNARHTVQLRFSYDPYGTGFYVDYNWKVDGNEAAPSGNNVCFINSTDLPRLQKGYAIGGHNFDNSGTSTFTKNIVANTSKQRIYSIVIDKFSANTKATRNSSFIFYPVKRISDGKIGLLRKRVTNGTYDFLITDTGVEPTAGPTLNRYFPTKLVKKITDSQSRIIWGSPSDFPYRRLEYLECNGTAGARMGCRPSTATGNEVTKFKLKIRTTDDLTGQNRIIANYSGGTTYPRMYAVIQNAGTFQNTIGTNWGNGPSAATNTTYTIETSMLYNNRYLKINGTNYVLTSMNSFTAASATSYGLGASLTGTTSDTFEQGFKGRIYDVEGISSNGNRYFYYIPAQRKSDNKVGFLKCSVFSGVFNNDWEFLPSNWTSDFTAGPITDEYLDMSVAPTVNL